MATAKLFLDPYTVKPSSLKPGESYLLAETTDTAVASTGTALIAAKYTNASSRVVYLTGTGFKYLSFQVYNNSDKDVTCQIYAATNNRLMAQGDTIAGATLATLTTGLPSAGTANGWDTLGSAFTVSSGGGVSGWKNITVAAGLYALTATVSSGTSTAAVDARCVGTTALT